MYKVLIVEDEMLVRIGLKNSIPWEDYDMEVIADVSNGEEALRVYKSDRPDVIITDLKMPVMDGLTFITTVREQDADTRIVILSCIEEFEYARKAANLKVSGYILKLTMTLDEMGQVLADVRSELKTRSASVRPVSLNHRSLNVLKEKLITDYLNYGTYTDAELGMLLSSMESRIGLGRGVVALLETSEYTRLLKRFNDNRGELIRFTILNLTNEILSNHDAGEAYYDNDNRYLLFFSLDEKLSEECCTGKLNDIFENIQNAMNTYFDVSVFVVYSSFGNGYSALKRQYQECRSAMEEKFFSESNILAAEARPNGNTEYRWKRMMRESSGLWERLGPEDEKALKKQIDQLLQRPLTNEQSWKRTFLDLKDWTCTYLGISEEHAALIELDGSQRLKASSTIKSCFEAWEHHLVEAAKAKSMIKSVSKDIADAVHYIHAHYDKDISLKEISDYVQLSPNYLSLLFKKNMGCNLIEFLTEYRVDKAKELLQSTTLKTYEIAENIGIPDSAYFSRIFKKSTGMSPVDFRKKKVFRLGSGLNE